MKLYGSHTSPFVRRTRLLLAGTPFEFIPMNIYEGRDRQILKTLSPVLKIPVLEDGEKRIYDSRVIFSYLCSKGLHAQPSWQDQNILTIVDGVSDSLVNILLLKRSNVVLAPDSVLGIAHSERIAMSLGELNRMAENGSFKEWNYAAISLYTLIDWVLFRELWSLEEFAGLLKFHKQNQTHKAVIASDPRLT